MTNRAEALRMTAVYLFLGAMALVSLFPFAWMVVGATNTSVDVTKGKFTLGEALVDNLIKLNSLFNLEQVFWSSTKIALVGGLATLMISSMAGYGFEVFSSKARERVYSGLR